MKSNVLTALAAASIAVAGLAGCDRPRDSAAYKPGGSRGEVPTARNERDTPPVPIQRAKPDIPPGTPSAEQKRPPVEGQVDPRHPEQRRDFQRPPG